MMLIDAYKENRSGDTEEKSSETPFLPDVVRG